MKVAVSELQAKNEILQRQTMSLKEEHSLQKHKFEELCKVHVRLLSTICIPKNLPYTIWLKYISGWEYNLAIWHLVTAPPN